MQDRSASVHVCPLRHVPAMIAYTGARHLVSVINTELLPATPRAIAPEHHLKLTMHDITEIATGATPPALDHVMELLEFVRGWDQTAPLLIHCYAGLSRSTAAAYISLCALNPETPEEIIAHALRRSSDTAIPNRLFVEIADLALRRNGRMLAALASMGPHRLAAEGTPFSVEARHAAPELESAAPAARSGRAAGAFR